MKTLKSLFTLLLIAFTGIQAASAQATRTTEPNNDGSIFWEVSGNGLKESSYLFGTFHLLTSSYVDSMPLVLQKFRECKTFAGELKMDSTLMPKMQEAASLKETTLDKLLSKADYDSTATWLKELTGYDLSMFNQANPMTVSTVFSAFVAQRVFPQNTSKPEPGMDQYFQILSMQSGKEITGLEKIEDQIHALFTQFTYERQAELLMAMVKQKNQVGESMVQMLNSYKHMNLGSLMTFMYDDTFTKSEIENILDNRNKEWMKQLPAMMQQSSVFVAVGALHLGGENGLVQLLRKAGYSVTPINS